MAPIPPGLAALGLGKRPRRKAPFPVFRGRRVDPHSIFGKGFGLRLQMDVWSRLTGDPREPEP
jgi:hypothetical protein